MLAELAADQDTAWQLPRLYELGARFGDLSLGPLLDELARREAGPDLAAAAFDYAWYTAILDQMRVLDPRYSADRGDALDEIAGDFRVHDIQHLAANRGAGAPGVGAGARGSRVTGIRCRPGSSASRPHCGAAICRCGGCSTRPAMCCSRSSRAGRCHR